MPLQFDRASLPPRPNLEFERQLWTTGAGLVGGVDEAGRGALAGPVFAAVVALSPDPRIEARLSGVDDSKKLAAAARVRLAAQVRMQAAACGIGFATAVEIDRYGILPATRLAIHRALLEMDLLPDHLLVDYLALPDVPIPQTRLVKGDARALSIAAASILAKTARDAHMLELARQYPGYRWSRNMGYGTAAHREALAALGPCPEHRRSFAPLHESLSDTTGGSE